MLNPSNLHVYQRNAVMHQCKYAESMLWLDMGLGKTVITLTSIAHLIKQGYLSGVLIVAPVRVCRMVWRKQSSEWSHTNHLTFSLLLGNRDHRTRSLLKKADIYLINYENLGWLSETLHTYFVSKNRPAPFDGLVFDEISKMKNSTTQRVKAFQKSQSIFKWRTGLTGTPASNGYKDLHGQYLVIDKGVRLGTSKTAFKQRFYQKVGPFKEVIRDGAEDIIKKLISDITLEMSAADYLTLPEVIYNTVEVELPAKVRAKYDALEKEFFTVLDSGVEIELFNQASLTNKLLQFSNGALYMSGNGDYEQVHDEKLEALEEIIDEAQGSPVLCAYAYRSDADRIIKYFSKKEGINPINLTDCKTDRQLQAAMHAWETGTCRLMIGHPACLTADTEVLTEFRGWQKIVDVTLSDRVFDGIEYVNHDGCSYSGYKEVIDVLGITMTPNHKLLIDNEWVEAKNVKTIENAREKALYRKEKFCDGIGRMHELRYSERNDSSELFKKFKKKWSEMLKLQLRPSNDKHAILSDMEWNNQSFKGRIRYFLQRTRDIGLSGMEGVFKLLSGYVSKLSGTFNDRTNKCKSGLQQRELYVDYNVWTTSKQTQQSNGYIQGRNYAFSGVMPTFGIQQNDAINSIKQGNDRRGSSTELREQKAHVYDLINCGKRHRFLIRNKQGEQFISHNSMGHGIDGLQKNGHIVAWFGLNWSLDLVQQMNARINRQGQKKKVIVHQIITKGTMDEAQKIALSDKESNQESLKRAVNEYRKTKGY